VVNKGEYFSPIYPLIQQKAPLPNYQGGLKFVADFFSSEREENPLKRVENSIIASKYLEFAK
jgi:hypothetical protein